MCMFGMNCDEYLILCKFG
uniref:Uncharacterized protein n=1 Tax=Rhizophora mucronata TaxID=61149 RepID=A0A2P2QMQ9_RHIMU